MKKSNKKGITLVALVITIIVLLILAGITINLAIGERGIIKMAQKAGKEYQDANIKEIIELYKLDEEMGTSTTLKEKLVQNNILNEEKLQKLETDGIVDLSNNILVITNYTGLKKLSENVNNGNDYSGKTIYMLNDINCGATFNVETGELLTGENFVPIGNDTKKVFIGTFDGVNYKITNLYIKEEDPEKYTGFFGVIGQNAIVQNLTISDSYIHGYYEVGAITGRNLGKIENCINKSTIISDYVETGGISGKCFGSAEIKNCTNYGNVKSYGAQIGGITGNCDNGNISIANCTNYGTIEGEKNYIGGIVGGIFNTAKGDFLYTISNCINEGTINGIQKDTIGIGGILGYTQVYVTSANISNNTNNGQVNGYDRVGGIAGINTAVRIENCKNTGEVYAIYRGAGGISGGNLGGTITKCYNKGTITLGEEGFFGAGGIAGQMGSATSSSIIELSYNEGNVIALGTSYQAAGIVGNASVQLDETGTKPQQLVAIYNCYNKGDISGKILGGIVSWARNLNVTNCYNVGSLSSAQGGIVADYADNLKLTNNYWLDTCGASYGVYSSKTNDKAESKTSDEIKGLTNTLGENYKEDKRNINKGYPVLSWQ